jgi:hypothetical protein
METRRPMRVSLLRAEHVVLRLEGCYEVAKRAPLHRLARTIGHGSLDITTLHVSSASGDLQRVVEERAWA